jgi:NADH-ubiquinone oxidoreductase chain 5
MNRVGDMILSIGFFSIFGLFGCIDFISIFNLAPSMNETAITIIGLLLLGGAMAKSSQIGLHTWLPGSMEGPTPVSALIHAATLVTAGAYLLLRSSPILEYSSTALITIAFIGSLTAFFAGTVGLFQNDLKRIVAFSTISQMGYLFMGIGLSQYSIALFHLINHAFFKGLLFLACGAIIHSMIDQQDIRKLGGLLNFLPFTYICILIGSLSLMASPWLTGFYSKDLIIELSYANYNYTGFFAFFTGTATAFLTAFYSFRLISMTFLSYPNASKLSYEHIHEVDIFVIIPLFFLSLFSIFFGYFLHDVFIGIGSDFMGASLFQHPSHVTLIDAEFSLPLHIKLLPVLVTFVGAILGLLVYPSSTLFSLKLYLTMFKNPLFNYFGYKVYRFFINKYFIDIIYNGYIIHGGLKMGYILSKLLDRGFLELIGPYGVALNLNVLGKSLSQLDTGIITTYALYITLGIFLILFYIFSIYSENVLISSSINFRLIIIYIVTSFIVLFPSAWLINK